MKSKSKSKSKSSHLWNLNPLAYIKKSTPSVDFLYDSLLEEENYTK